MSSDKIVGKEQKPQVFSCGFLVMRKKKKKLQFLLMKHADRWDLPKGHVDPGETKLQTALRELYEETGIQDGQIEIDPGYEFVNHYWVKGKNGRQRLKELTIYLATLKKDFANQPIIATEHQDSRWFDWKPPQSIEPKSVDALLASVASYLASRS